jgi:Pvc16 N-terminal domain
VAGYGGLAAAGVSIVGLLNRRFAGDPDASAANLQAFLASSSELKTMINGLGQLISRPAVSVYCYKVSVDRDTRPGWSAVATGDGIPRLPLKMHLLIAAWGGNAEEELRWLGLSAQILESEGVLAGPMLDAQGDWRPDEIVTVVADDLALDTVSEAFQALSTDYRLSLPYIARVVVLEGRREAVGGPVSTVAARSENLDKILSEVGP